MDTGALIAVGAVQGAEAGPVEPGDLVAPGRGHRPGKAVEVERGQHEARAAVTVVVLAGVERLRRYHREPARNAGQVERVIGGARSVWRRQQAHVLDGHVELL